MLSVDDSGTNYLSPDRYMLSRILLSIREADRVSEIEVFGRIEHEQVPYSTDTFRSKLRCFTRRNSDICQLHSLSHHRPSNQSHRPLHSVYEWSHTVLCRNA